MVASKEEEVFRVFDLVGHEQADTLERLFAPVNIISQEEVVCVRDFSANPE